jgi:predicted RNase H-like nuclease (RuvC/YqgF family)
LPSINSWSKEFSLREEIMSVSALSSGHYHNVLQLTAPADETAELEFQWQQAAAMAKAQTATAAGGGATDAKSDQSTSKNNESFFNQMLEQLIAKRIGLDKKKIDEIKAEIEKLQQQRDALAEQVDTNPKVAQQLTQLDNKIAALTKMMEEQIAQDLERRSKQEQQQLHAENAKNTLVQKYQSLI